VPAVMERWQSRPGAPRPGMMAGGGMTDSCYMWRHGRAHMVCTSDWSADRSRRCDRSKHKRRRIAIARAEEW
jgi:hypothetical protein